jgi:outer membrane protein insertion porin family
MEVVSPLPFVKDSKGVRVSAFVDVGSVYDTYGEENVDLGKLRVSTGIAGTWFSPLGPLSVSLALPVKKESDDEEQAFQFTLGAVF